MVNQLTNHFVFVFFLVFIQFLFLTYGLSQSLQLCLLLMEGALLQFGQQNLLLLHLQLILLLQLTIPEGRKRGDVRHRNCTFTEIFYKSKCAI